MKRINSNYYFVLDPIILIGISVTSVLIKKSKEEIVMTPVTATSSEKVTQEVPIVATTTVESTTTEIMQVTSTTTASSTSNEKSFIDKKWTWMETITTHSYIKPKQVKAFTVTFTATGTLTGTTDCNNFYGTYKIASNTLSFGPLVTTKIYCEDSQESEFMHMLQYVTKYSMDKNLMLRSVSAGIMVFR